MARIRTIKPEFFTDADLAELPPLVRLFFAGLFCQADKAGRMKDKPSELGVRVMPYDHLNPEKALERLSDTGFIIRYEVDGCRYIQIRTWAKHQRPHHTEAESIIPLPNGGLTVTPPLDNGGKGREGKGKEGIGKEGSAVDTPATPLFDPRLPIDLPACLDTFDFRHAWSEWIEHRKQIRKKLTPLAVTKQIKRLAEMGETRARRAIDYTIEKQWTGLREPDPEPDGPESGGQMIDVGAEMAAMRKEVDENDADAKAHPLGPMSAAVRKVLF